MDLLPGLGGLGLPPPPLLERPADEAPAPPPAPPPTHCASCRADNAKLRCGICKKVVYCTPACQKSDWQFHKRICSKPVAAAPAPAPAAAPSPSPAPAPSPAAAPLAAKPSSEVMGDDDLDEDERAAVEQVRKMGYRYFSRKPTTEEAAAIGDIRPKAVAAAPAPTPAPVPVAAAAAAAPRVTNAAGDGSGSAVVSPPPPAAAAASASTTGASAWNAAGTTHETRALGDFVRGRLKELIGEARRSGAAVVGPIPGVGRLVATGISGWGDSSADVIIARGKTKRVYDLCFKVVVQVVPEEAASDADVAAMDVDGEGEGGKDGGSGSGGSGGGDDGKKKPAKHPRALIFFPDVNNETEGAPRDVVLEWGSPAPPDAQRDVIRTALAVEAGAKAGPTAALRAIVEKVVEEFKAR